MCHTVPLIQKGNVDTYAFHTQKTSGRIHIAALGSGELSGSPHTHWALVLSVAIWQPEGLSLSPGIHPILGPLLD